MTVVGRLWRLGLAASFLVSGCIGTAPPTAASPFAATQAAPSGRWFVDADPVIPVAGHSAVIFLEFVPDPAGLYGATPPGIGGSQLTLSARCLDCDAAAHPVVAQPYVGHGPGDVNHAGASVGYSAHVMLPSAGCWSLEPLGLVIEVRALEPFEPPLIHMRPWSEPLPTECGRRYVAGLFRDFESAYNAGDAVLLTSVVQEAIDFSIAGGAAPFIARGRDAFVAGALDRQSRGERINFTKVNIATDRGGIGLAVDAVRTAPDLPGGRQRLSGKAATWCNQQQFIHLNLGVHPG
jgi:hypothetical protein